MRGNSDRSAESLTALELHNIKSVNCFLIRIEKFAATSGNNFREEARTKIAPLC